MPKTEMIASFIERIDGLDTRQRVLLKRSYGTMLNDVGSDTLTVFYRVLPHNCTENEDRLFAAACIHCLWDADETGRMPMEKAIARLKMTESLSDSFEHRFTVLLDTPWSADGFLVGKLVRMAKMLKQKGIAVDGAALAEDLIQWNSSYKTVQKKWAKAFCHTEYDDNNEEEKEED